MFDKLKLGSHQAGYVLKTPGHIYMQAIRHILCHLLGLPRNYDVLVMAELQAQTVEELDFNSPDVIGEPEPSSADTVGATGRGRGRGRGSGSGSGRSRVRQSPRAHRQRLTACRENLTCPPLLLLASVSICSIVPVP